MVENCTFYISRHARKSVRDKAEALSIILPNSRIFRFSSVEGDITVPDNTRNAMVFGGDGSVRHVASSLFQKAPEVPLIIAPGGSFNAFYRSLVREVPGITSYQLANGEEPKTVPFFPAEANGNLFNVVAELGVLAKEFKADRRRISSGTLRTYEHWLQGAAAFIRGIRKYPPAERTIRILSTGPFMGQYETNPLKSILGDSLTYTTIQSDSEMDFLRKTLIFGFCLRFGKKIPEIVAEIQEGSEFVFEDEGITVGNFDGERVQITDNIVTVRRYSQSLKVAPLILD
jgi:hypothetical protein